MYTPAQLTFRYRQCLCGYERYGMRSTRVKCGFGHGDDLEPVGARLGLERGALGWADSHALESSRVIMVANK